MLAASRNSQTLPGPHPVRELATACFFDAAGAHAPTAPPRSSFRIAARACSASFQGNSCDNALSLCAPELLRDASSGGGELTGPSGRSRCTCSGAPRSVTPYMLARSTCPAPRTRATGACVMRVLSRDSVPRCAFWLAVLHPAMVTAAAGGCCCALWLAVLHPAIVSAAAGGCCCAGRRLLADGQPPVPRASAP